MRFNRAPPEALLEEGRLTALELPSLLHSAPHAAQHRELRSKGGITMLEPIGNGRCGAVRKGRMDREWVAVKSISTEDAAKREQLVNELRVLAQSSQSTHLVQWMGAFVAEDSHVVHVVMEFMDLGSLADLRARHTCGLAAGMLSNIAHQGLLGVDWLHEHSIIHRDVKPANMLHNSKGTVKLSDYGLAKYLSADMCDTQLGTMTHMAPERILGEAYSYPSDIWGIGLVFYELAAGRYPYTHTSNMLELWQHVCEGDMPPLPPALPESMKSLIMDKCLCKNPAVRLSAASLLALEPLQEASRARDSELAAWFKCVQGQPGLGA